MSYLNYYLSAGRLFFKSQVMGSLIIIIIAIFINTYFSLTKEGWVVLAAFMTSQTTHGTPFRQGILHWVVMLVALSLAFALTNMTSALTLYGVLAAVFVISSYLIKYNEIEMVSSLFFIITFVVVLFTAALLPFYFPFYAVVIDITLGAIIALIINQLLFSQRQSTGFKQGIVPVLTALMDYTYVQGIILHAIQADQKIEADLLLLQQAKFNISQSLQKTYPGWVYESGFNPGLRSSWRFFLIHLEWVVEIYLSMHYLLMQLKTNELFSDLAPSIVTVMNKNQELLTMLLDYFSNKNPVASEADYTGDMTALEEALKTRLPANMELLDISTHYLYLTAFVRDVKDLREQLLQLVLSIAPTANYLGET